MLTKLKKDGLVVYNKTIRFPEPLAETYVY